MTFIIKDGILEKYKAHGEKSVVIPDGVTEIRWDAFSGCTNLTVICSRGSCAEKYCKANGISYKTEQLPCAEKPGIFKSLFGKRRS